jgi:hypothetical protein
VIQTTKSQQVDQNILSYRTILLLQQRRTYLGLMTNLPTSNTRRLVARRRFTVASATLLVVLVAGALALTTRSVAARSTIRPSAVFSVRTLNATDTAHLHFIRSSGSLLFEEGSASGTLPGKMQAHCDVGPTVTASFTIFVRGGGTIRGHGTAKAHGSGRYESFAGSLIVTGGTGRYTHAHGHAGLYGVFDRRTYAMTVQTAGRLVSS